MSGSLFQVTSPCIEPVTTKEKSMRIRILSKRFVDCIRERRHVLRIVDDRNPFSMQMCADAMKSLQHFIPFDCHAAFEEMKIEKNSGPNVVRMNHRARAS